MQYCKMCERVSIYAHLGMCVCAHMYAHTLRPEAKVRCLARSPSTLFWKQTLSLNLELFSLVRIDIFISCFLYNHCTPDIYLSPPKSTGVADMFCHHDQLFMWFWASNLVTHTCFAGTLLTKPPLQHFNNLFIKKQMSLWAWWYREIILASRC